MVVGDFPEERDTIVIGAGPGGMQPAIQLHNSDKKLPLLKRILRRCVLKRGMYSFQSTYHNRSPF